MPTSRPVSAPSAPPRRRPKTIADHAEQRQSESSGYYGFTPTQVDSVSSAGAETPVGQTPDARGHNATAHVSRATRAMPTPLPKRDKGKWFIGTVLLLFLGLATHAVWDSLFRYPVRGEVVGRVIKVSPPWPGTLRTLHVHEGQMVAPDQLLMTFSSIDLNHRLDEVADELRLAQAELGAQVSQLQWQSQLRGDQSQKALGEYYELWGQLLHESSKLDQTAADLARYEATRSQNALAVSDKQLEAARFADRGQRSKVEKLSLAVAEMKKRVDIYDQGSQDASAQFRPQLLRIEQLQAELTRTRQQLQQGEVRSPVGGRVVSVRCFAGEYADTSQPVIEVVEAGSLRAVLYVPQDRIHDLECADAVDLCIEPQDETVSCRVERIGTRMSPAPPSVERYYRSNERLLPIYLRPHRYEDAALFLRLGSEVRLADWSRGRESEDETPRRDDQSTPRSAAPAVQSGNE